MIRATTTSGSTTMIEQQAVDDLVTDIDGEVIGPDDVGYDESRRVWNGMIDRYPALVVRVEAVADVVRAINFARRYGLLTAVRGGGHNVAGHGTGDGCLVIDLSLMTHVDVYPDTRVVRVGGGATLGDVDAVTQEYGLAVPCGVVSETGIAGLTLNGGLGWLRSKYGLTLDNLVSAEVVTVDGEVVTASERENPDLLWGLRGGGGNFGVVTTFTYRAHPVGPEVFFTAVLYHGKQTGEVLRLHREFNASAPDAVSTIASLGIIPEGADAYPADIHGQPFVALVGMLAGSVDEGEQTMEPLRGLSEPLADFSGPMPYVDAQQFYDEDYPNGLRYYWKSVNLMELSDAAIDRIVHHARRQPSQLSSTDLWPIRGAVKRVADEATAFHGRHADLVVSFESNWETPATDDANVQWARNAVADMEGFSDGTRYLNFPGFQEGGDAAMRAAFGPRYERLAQLKRKYDPTNLLRMNANIKPASS